MSQTTPQSSGSGCLRLPCFPKKYDILNTSGPVENNPKLQNYLHCPIKPNRWTMFKVIDRDPRWSTRACGSPWPIWTHLVCSRTTQLELPAVSLTHTRLQCRQEWGSRVPAGRSAGSLDSKLSYTSCVTPGKPSGLFKSVSSSVRATPIPKQEG